MELPNLQGKQASPPMTEKGYRTCCGNLHFMGTKIIGLLESPIVKGNTAKLPDQALRE